MDLSLYIDKHHLCANMDPYAAGCSPLSETDRHQNSLHGYGVGALSIQKTAMQCNQVSSCCCCCCFVCCFLIAQGVCGLQCQVSSLTHGKLSSENDKVMLKQHLWWILRILCARLELSWVTRPGLCCCA